MFFLSSIQKQMGISLRTPIADVTLRYLRNSPVRALFNYLFLIVSRKNDSKKDFLEFEAPNKRYILN